MNTSNNQVGKNDSKEGKGLKHVRNKTNEGDIIIIPTKTKQTTGMLDKFMSLKESPTVMNLGMTSKIGHMTQSSLSREQLRAGIYGKY